ncbi:MAG: hypothetical protein ACYCT1_05955 [Steroidobacteraceae bacterium]
MARRKAIQEHEDQCTRDRAIGHAWNCVVRAKTAAGSTKRKAHADATSYVSARFGLSARRVQQICRWYATEIVPAVDRLERALRVTLEPRRELFRRARLVLGEEDWATLRDLRGDSAIRIVRAIVDGAAAAEENKKLRAQLTAWKGMSDFSAKRKKG